MTLRVALDATAYDAQPSGARTRAVGLAAALLARGCAVTLIVPRGLSLTPLVEDEAGGAAPAGRLVERATTLRPGAALRRAVRARAEAEDLARGADVHLTDYHPVLRGVPTTLTIHDLRYLAGPSPQPRTRAAWFRAAYPRLVARARWVTTPTEAVRREVLEHLGAPAERVVVVPNGLSRPWRGTRVAPGPGRHLLAVGMADPRKGLEVLVAALRRASSRGPVLPLVLAGRTSPAQARALARAADLVDAGLLRDAGPVPDAELVALARDAALLLHPSRYEGFGLPVLEALAIGLPVVAGRGAAVEEVAGGAAAFLPPDDVDAWAAALADPPARPAPEGVERAARFSWGAAADRLLRLWTAARV